MNVWNDFGRAVSHFLRVLLFLLSIALGVGWLAAHYLLLKQAPSLLVVGCAVALIAFGMYGLQKGDLTGFAESIVTIYQRFFGTSR